MKPIKKTLKQIWQDESGQGATEYILMIVVVVAIVFAFRSRITEIIGEKTESLGTELGSITSQ